MPGLQVLPPEATYMAWLDCRALELPADPFDFFLERARVALTRGSDFGAPGKGCVRLNFATSRAILLEILERMEAALGRRSSIG
jgi:cystathionine beta-lyase